MALLVQQPGFGKHVAATSENYFKRGGEDRHSKQDSNLTHTYNMDHLKSLASMFPHLYNPAAVAGSSGLPHNHTNLGGVPPLSSMLYPPVMNPLLTRMPGNYHIYFFIGKQS